MSLPEDESPPCRASVESPELSTFRQRCTDARFPQIHAVLVHVNYKDLSTARRLPPEAVSCVFPARRGVDGMSE
jgi:hypothetical protein